MTDAIFAILYAIAGLAVFALMLAGILLKDELNKLETRVDDIEKEKKDMR